MTQIGDGGSPSTSCSLVPVDEDVVTWQETRHSAMSEDGFVAQSSDLALSDLTLSI